MKSSDNPHGAVSPAQVAFRRSSGGRSLCRVLLSVAAWLAPAAAWAQAEIADLTVTAQVTDQVCVEKYDFLLRNPTAFRIEHDFILPIDPQAQATQFSMLMGNEVVEARIMDKEKAAAVYSEIVRSKRDPGLLEHQGRGLIRARIFPIEPNSETRVSLTLTRMLPNVRGTIRLTTLYSMPGVQQIGHVAYRATIRSQKPLSAIYSPSHSVSVQRRDERTAVVQLDQAPYTAGQPLELAWSVGEGDLGVTMLAHRLPGERGYFLLIVSPRATHTEEQLLPKEIVFCVDTSGSMAGVKMEQARKALRYCIEQLPGRDRFTLVRFSDDVSMFRTELVPADAENKEKALSYVDGLKAEGGTNIDAALRASLGLFHPSKNVKVLVFVTDGEPTIGETSPDRIVEGVRKLNQNVGAAVVCFGVGTDVEAPLLDRVAHETRGHAEYVLPHEDLSQKLVAFAGKIQGPVMTEVALRFPDTELEEVYPRDVTTLYADQQIVVAGRYLTTGERSLIVTGRQASREVKMEFPVTFPETEGQNEFLVRLWAGRKIGFLLGEIQRNGANPELVGEVKRLAKRHGIVTPYTSYIALEKEHRERYYGWDSAGIPGGGGFNKGIEDPVYYNAPEEEASDTPNDEGLLKARGESMDNVPDKPFRAKSAYDAIGGGGGGSGAYGWRFGGKSFAVNRGGGGRETEDLVLGALRWLAMHQEEDGSWNPEKFHERCKCANEAVLKSRIEATALALSAFLGAGYTHLSNDSFDGVRFGDVIKKGIDFLLTKQDVATGGIGVSPRETAAAAWALSEAYGLTGSSLLRDPALKAAEKVAAAARAGELREEETFAPAALALYAAHVSELPVPNLQEAGQKLIEWAGSSSNPAAALFRILWTRSKKEALDQVRALEAVPPAADQDPAYWFFASCAMYQVHGPEGAAWKTWNDALRRAAADGFAATGCEKGSAKRAKGRLEATAWMAMALQCYYRYPAVVVDRAARPSAGISGKESEVMASRDASNLSRAEKIEDLVEKGGECKSVGSKTFYLSRGVWVDSAFDPATEEKNIRKVKFMSEEYDALIRSDAELARYLSVGTDVVVVHKGAVLWVRE